MDAFEIMSVARSYSGLEGQNNIGDLMLLRFANMANKSVSQLLLPLFQQYLIKTTIKLSQSGTQVEVPGDALRLINVERELVAAGSNFKPASPVDVANKTIIGVNPDFIAKVNFPLFVDEGRYVQVYPTMTSLDVRLQYRKRIADMIYGKVQDVGAGSNTVTFDVGANLADDYYNDYYLALYKVTSGEHALHGTHLITDYAGSTLVATISPVTDLTDGHEVFYALVPILPDEFHNLIVDGTLIELSKSNRIEKDASLENSFAAKINAILTVNQVIKAK